MYEYGSTSSVRYYFRTSVPRSYLCHLPYSRTGVAVGGYILGRGYPGKGGILGNFCIIWVYEVRQQKSAGVLERRVPR